MTSSSSSPEPTGGPTAAPVIPLPARPTAPTAPPRGAGRPLLAPVLFLWRRAGQTLGVLALLALLGLAAGVRGLTAWPAQPLRAARAALERGHNGEAIRHLRACRLVHPDHPEVLLLSARVARRAGSWAESEALLDRYWQLRG